MYMRSEMLDDRLLLSIPKLLHLHLWSLKWVSNFALDVDHMFMVGRIIHAEIKLIIHVSKSGLQGVQSAAVPDKFMCRIHGPDE